MRGMQACWHPIWKVECGVFVVPGVNRFHCLQHHIAFIEQSASIARAMVGVLICSENHEHLCVICCTISMVSFSVSPFADVHAVGRVTGRR